MNKSLPYVLGAVAVALLVYLMITARNAAAPERYFDERVTLRQRDAIPYGTKVARRLLPEMFPYATVPYEVSSPFSWDSVNAFQANQAVIVVADFLDADEDELEEMAAFVEEGNYVFLIAHSFSAAVPNYFGAATNTGYYNYYNTDAADSFRTRLEPAAFGPDSFYSFPGLKADGYFHTLDTLRTTVLGRNEQGYPNFVRMDRGTGSFFIHTAPLAFSNYFILHRGNSRYFEKALSVMPRDLETVAWNEYYLQKPQNLNNNREPNWLGGLMSQPPFKWGLVTAAVTLLLAVLLGMRRRQRMVPYYPTPVNDSLDFVQTLGRLYYDRRDHKNLATKMGAYFLEYVRSTYKLPTHTLNDEFIKSLHFKSGRPVEEVAAIINAINEVHLSNTVSEGRLATFHRQLEAFYQNT